MENNFARIVTMVTTKRIAAIFACISLTLLFSKAAIAGNWPVSSILNVSGSYSVSSITPVGAADKNGNVVALWDENFQILAGKNYSGWKTPNKISGTAVAKTPSVVSDSIGLYAVWYANDGVGDEIVFSMSNDGINWTIPTKVTFSPATFVSSPDISIVSDGTIYVVWNEDGKIYIKSSTDYGNSWSSALLISGTSSCSKPCLDTDENGKICVAYEYNKQITTDPPAFCKEIYYCSSSNGGSSWEPYENVSNSTSQTSANPDIAADNAGNVFVVWEEYSTLGTDIEIFAKKKSASGWGASTSVSESQLRNDEAPAITFSRSGEIRLAWSHWQGVIGSGDLDILGRVLINGTWKAVQTVADTSGPAKEPYITDNGSGNTVVLWQDGTTNINYYEIYGGETAGGFTMLSTDFESDTLGVAGNGWSTGDDDARDVTAYWDDANWTGYGGSSKSAWCAGYGGIISPGIQYIYRPYMSAFMKRTLDLREYKDAQLEFWWKTPSTDISGDHANDFGVLNLTAGSLFDQVYYRGASLNWTKSTVDLTPYCGKNLLLDWHWVSDGTNQYEGMYVDNISIAGNVKEPVDSIAPSKITNLQATEITKTSLKLTWTATGDDGPYGTASSYDIRYASANITSDTWATAKQVSGEPIPKIAGSSESMTIPGLEEGTQYYFAIKAVDDQTLTSDLSNILTISTIGDTIAPAAITDLAIESAGMYSITLSWTATGDDSSTGTASTYDVRYSTSAITADNWAAATQASNEPAPQASGVTEFFTVTGLAGAKTYYFAVKAIDNNLNASALSNIPLGQTTTVQGDINFDGRVNIFDLVIVGKAFGTKPGQTGWDERADMNNDDVINIFDLVLIGKNFGKSV